MNKEIKDKTLGFYAYTCCEGCSFTMLFIEGILDLLGKFEVQHFYLLKEENPDTELNLAFVDGAITTTTEIQELKKVRERSWFVVAMGACACNGGVPAMRILRTPKPWGNGSWLSV